MTTPHLTYDLNSDFIREYYKDHVFGNRRAAEELTKEWNKVFPLWEKYAAKNLDETIAFERVCREYCRAVSEAWRVAVFFKYGGRGAFKAKDEVAVLMDKRFKELEEFAARTNI